MELFVNERLDYIGKKDLKIIQANEMFSFSLDAVLLAKFVHVPIRKGKLVDLCSGNGVIPLLLSERTKGQITAIEIQEKLCDMAERSIRLNQLEDKIDVICQDINRLSPAFLNGSYDVVTCNPPYFKVSNEKDVKQNDLIAGARHEIYCTLEDTVRTMSKLLKQGGKGAFVHRPKRLVEIIELMKKYKLEPKRIQFVYPKRGLDANIVLIEGTKGGKSDVNVLSPLVVYKDNNEYTDEMKAILYER
ncbi:tRNA1(Val) (adenine(37)-N6)-methyltransferase [Pueribacillus sp. YX66]|uniref:tRNA1(Val) (adenine(37)-N6)-methyltransferase n=1 Tax=Pueribacillus sp. YX66 TaxID=3229242 RepID=UPI00358CF74C